MNLDKLPFNWFDLVVVIVIVTGLMRGRKRGMSEELMSVLMWLAIAFGCAFLYQPVGTMISQNTVFSELSAYCMAYLGIGLIIAILFGFIKRGLGGKLVGSDAFGRSEFYLGMVAGMIRFLCVMIAALALLNARSYNQTEVTNELKYQKEVYGSDFFPTLHSIQSQVFEKSFMGPLIKNNLSVMLIKPTTPQKKEIKRREIATP